jgi:hypothetical protein
MAKSAQEAGLIGKEVPEGQLVASMEKLMQDGKLLSKDVLPFFAKNLREIAYPAITKALENNRVAMGRMVNSVQLAAADLFEAGFGEGLTDLFNSLSSSVTDLIPLWKSLGRIFGSVFKAVAFGIKLITPPLRLLGDILDIVTKSFDKFSIVTMPLLSLGLLKAASSMKIFSGATVAMKAAASSLLAPFARLASSLIIFDELYNRYISKDRLGIGYDPRTDPSSKLFDEERYQKQFGKSLGGRPSVMNGAAVGGGQTTVVLQVDSETLGEVSWSTQSMKNGVASMISPLLVP